MRPRIAPAATSGLLATLAIACGSTTLANEEAVFERSLNVDYGPVQLVIGDSSTSNVDIATGGRGEVVIRGTIHGYPGWWRKSKVQERVRELEANPPIEQDGNTLRVGSLPWSVRRDLSFSYQVVVPPNTNVEAHATTIRVDGLIGDLRASGDKVKASGVSGNIAVSQTQVARISGVNDDVEVYDADTVAIDRVSGDVSVVNSGKVKVSDVDGDFTLTERGRVASSAPR